MRPPRLAPFLVAASVTLVACSFGGDADGVRVSFSGAPADSAVPLGPDDVVVTSSDGALRLAVVGDSVHVQLADSVRRSVRTQVDSSAGDGIGGVIARSVGSAVQTAMGFTVRIPVQDVENVRYEDGRIRFETRGKSSVSFSRSRGGDTEDGIRVSPADGERFVDAVRRRQQQGRQAL